MRLDYHEITALAGNENETTVSLSPTSAVLLRALLRPANQIFLWRGLSESERDNADHIVALALSELFVGSGAVAAKRVATTVQTLDYNVWRAVYYADVLFDTGALTLAGDDTDFYISETGLYVLCAKVRFAPNPTGWRGVRIHIDRGVAGGGGDYVAVTQTIEPGGAYNGTADVSATTVERLFAGDRVWAEARHVISGAGSLDTMAGEDITQFWIYRV